MTLKARQKGLDVSIRSHLRSRVGEGLVGSGGSWRSPEGLAAAPGTREAGEEAARAGGVGVGWMKRKEEPSYSTGLKEACAVGPSTSMV